MGEYLSTPNKQKMSEDGEGMNVSCSFFNVIRLILLFFSCDTEQAECKAGEKAWKMLTSRILM
jgi:hypothetical protein